MSLPTLAEIEKATDFVHSVMTPTPQICWPLLCKRSGAEVWVKHENHTPIGAFKVRGGLVFAEELRRKGGAMRLIGATRGNHGQSVALSAARVGLEATVVVPRGNAQTKNAAMRAFGAELIEHGDDFQETLEYTQELVESGKYTFVPSFDVGLVKGVASYGLELFRAVPNLDTVYVPVGLGSGICGVIAARDGLGLNTKVVGVVSENAAAYAHSFAAGKLVSTNTANTLADGMACRVPDGGALQIILKGAERIVTVSDDEILDAMAHFFTDTHNLAEGAGAAPLAALLQERDNMAGKKVGLILSGGNMDAPLLQRALEHCQPLD